MAPSCASSIATNKSKLVPPRRDQKDLAAGYILVAVAQQAERQFVALVVGGSSPLGHPNEELIMEEKKCEGCGEPIGHIPESAKLFTIRAVDEPDREPDLCLSCITAGVNALAKGNKDG